MIQSYGTTTYVTFKVSGLASIPTPLNINDTSILLGKTTILSNLTISDMANTILNTTTNKSSLYVSGNTILNESTTVSSTLNVLNDLSTSNVSILGTSNLNGPTTVSSTLNVLNNLSTSNVSILGTSNLNGPTTVSSTLNVLNNLSTSNVSILGTSNLNGPTTVSSTLNVLNNMTVSGRSNLNGPITVSSTLNVLNNMTVSGTSNLNGPTTVSSTLNVLNNLSTSNVSILGTSNLNGPTTVSSTLNVLNNLSTSNVSILGTSNLNGPTTVSSTLNVLNNITVSGTANLNGPLNINSTSKSTITGSLDINGDLNILGSTTYINTETVNIKDNLILINSNQNTIPSLLLQGGIEVERGPLDNYRFVFVEQDESFKVGVYNTSITDLQSVATRENVPITNGIPYWNSSQSRFDTTNNIICDMTTNKIIVSSINSIGSSNLNGGLTVSGSTNLLSSTTFLSTLNVSGLTTHNGATTFLSTLNVSGLTTYNGATTFLSTLNISGRTTYNGATTFLSTLNISGLTTHNGATTFLSTLNISGLTTYNGATTFLSTLNVSGSTMLNDLTLSNKYISSSLNNSYSLLLNNSLLTITQPYYISNIGTSETFMIDLDLCVVDGNSGDPQYYTNVKCGCFGVYLQTSRPTSFNILSRLDSSTTYKPDFLVTVDDTNINIYINLVTQLASGGGSTANVNYSICTVNNNAYNISYGPNTSVMSSNTITPLTINNGNYNVNNLAINNLNVSGSSYFSGWTGFNKTTPFSNANLVNIKPNGTFVDCLGLGTVADVNNIVNFYNASDAFRGRITGDGASAIRYETSSDKRLKKDIINMEMMIPKIKQLRPVQYTWKADNLKADGFIAQEVHKVFPSFIVKQLCEKCKDVNDIYSGKLCSCIDWENPLKNDGNMDTYCLDYSKFTPYLTKALQEIINIVEQQQTEIDNIKKYINYQ